MLTLHFKITIRFVFVLCVVFTPTSVSWLSSLQPHRPFSVSTVSKFIPSITKLQPPKINSKFHSATGAYKSTLSRYYTPLAPFFPTNWRHQSVLETLKSCNECVFSKNGLVWFPLISLVISRGVTLIKQKSERFSLN